MNSSVRFMHVLELFPFSGLNYPKENNNLSSLLEESITKQT